MPAIDRSISDCRYLPENNPKVTPKPIEIIQPEGASFTAAVDEGNVSKNDEFCITCEEFCIKNEEFCIKNDEFVRHDRSRCVHRLPIR